MNKTKEGLPLHPSQEIKPKYISLGLNARTRANAREHLLKRKVASAVADAMSAFAGTPSDEKLWANFAWKCGYATLLDAIARGRAEMAARRTPPTDAEKPAILQSIITPVWRKRGAK